MDARDLRAPFISANVRLNTAGTMKTCDTP